MTVWVSAVLAALAIMTMPAMAEEAVLLHAAGSLRAALTEVAREFETSGFGKVQAKFGASGLLKDEITGGAKAEVFASANMEHPRALASAKRSGPVVLFARNRLCALVRSGLEVTPASLLDRMVDPQVRLGTSTPKADPSGDYAWEVFRKAEQLMPGAAETLEKKALQLTGGPTSPPAPQGRSIYGELIAQGAADIFLTYCTSALAAQRENPTQVIVQLPDALAVGADYGLTVMNGASTPAYQFALFLLSTEGQRSLAKHGFAASALPQ
jgi:ABC-type molybdate transport system substrate-binding protein